MTQKIDTEASDYGDIVLERAGRALKTKGITPEADDFWDCLQTAAELYVRQDRGDMKPQTVNGAFIRLGRKEKTRVVPLEYADHIPDEDSDPEGRVSLDLTINYIEEEIYPRLTLNQQNLWNLLREGKPEKEIAESLGMDLFAVERHKKRLFSTIRYFFEVHNPSSQLQ